jgi:hypothetical protein
MLIRRKSRGNAAHLVDRQRSSTSPASVWRKWLKFGDATELFVATTPAKPEKSVMTKSENRCSNCGGKFGLVCHYHRGLRFCRKACKDSFLAKSARGHACMRRWLGFLPRSAA